MNDDPIVAEVRRVRYELAGAFGYDTHAIFADLRKRQTQFGDRLVQQPVAQQPNKAVNPSGGSGVD